jgi:hypothetical protein
MTIDKRTQIQDWEMKQDIESKSRKAVENHFRVINKMSKFVKENKEPLGKELQEMYGYLDKCWVCGKEFTFLDRISFNVVHSFEGNSHRRNCE